MSIALDPLESDFLNHLYALIQTGVACTTAAQIKEHLAERSEPRRVVAVIGLFESLGYLKPIAPPFPRGPFVRGSVAELAAVAHHNRFGPGKERWSIDAGAVIGAYREQAKGPTPDTLRTLSPSAAKAYFQYVKHVARHGPSTDKEAYKKIEEELGRGEELPEYETWIRYVRVGRKAHGQQKNARRKRFTPTRSVISPKDIEPRDIECLTNERCD